MLSPKYTSPREQIARRRLIGAPRARVLRLLRAGGRLEGPVEIPKKPETPCILWGGELNSSGYGRLRFKKAGRRWSYMAHRIAFERETGMAIPDGMQLDHLCRVHSCVNHEHLEVVTPTVNKLRGISICANEARQIACKNGHPLTGENLGADSGGRRCKRCQRVTKWNQRHPEVPHPNGGDRMRNRFTFRKIRN